MLTTEEAMQALTIRESRPVDSEALDRLAELDSSRPLERPALVAQVGDEIWAAVSLHDHRVISDPFRPSGELAFLLSERARQVHREQRRRRRRLGGGAFGFARLAA
jgi:hypothetical protein